jgi:Mg2+ and Co2+ transporter CorA
MPIYHSFVESSISRLSTRYSSTTSRSGDTSPFDSWSDILVNLKDILHRLEILHCRADKIMTVSMAVTGREESKKATQESHAITRVSYLAFIFVPLSFLTGFFSMSGEFPMRTYAVWAGVAIPVCMCALGALVCAGKVGRWWRGVRKERVLWNRGMEKGGRV